MDILNRLFGDRRLYAAARALELSGGALGDLAAEPAGAAAFFAPLKASLAAARNAPGAPEGSATVAAAEDFVRLLEKVFSETALFGAAPDLAVKEALLCLRRACELAPRLSGRRGAEAAAGILGLSGAARKALAGARAAADRDPGELTRNLKFSSIYSGLDAVFDALERCVAAYRSPS
jgi:hypothetical protein